MASAGCISVNGRVYEPHEATVSVLDAGFLLGDGLFESLRATDGVPYLLDRHLRRLLAAAAELEFAHAPSAEGVREQVLLTLERAALADAYVRVTVTRGTGGMGLAPPPGPPTVVVAVLPTRPLVGAECGIEATLLWQQRQHRPKPGDTRSRLASPFRLAAKSTSWQAAVVARRRVEACGAEEGLYVSADGHVLEGVASNVFAVTGGRLLTPPVEGCLPGVTRARVIELARAHGVPACEAPLELDALMHAEEVFVTNAVQGLRAVAAVAGAALGRQGPGGVFETLHGLYELDRVGSLERVG
jgi:branched-subunit amino acid aminotransferase/4-amino-4-deoxychorismate lyase